MFFDFFSGFDYAILSFFHNVVVSTDGSLNKIVQLFSMLGEKALPLILTALILTLFKKTRRTGVTMLAAIVFGALFTNVILKNLVMRARPFSSSAVYQSWWQMAGAVTEDEWSFPSGHATASMALGLSYFLTCKKSRSWLGLLFALMMGASRLYLCVHYPSDVLFGFIDGAVGAIIAYYLVNCAYMVMFKNSANKFVRFYFNFSVTELFKRKEKQNTERE